MHKNTTLVVAITQAKSEPWETIWREGQLPTWVNRYRNEFRIVNTSGIPMGKLWTFFDRVHEKNRYKSQLGKWQGRADYIFLPWLRRNIPTWKSLGTHETAIEEIQIQTNSSYIFAGRRLLGVIKWFVEQTQEPFLFLTTTSSFLNLRILEKKIEKYEKNSLVYAGNMLGDGPRKFVSGAGQLLSRSTAEVILESSRAYPHRMLNDVALSELLYSKGIVPEHIPWSWLRSEEEARLYEFENSANIFHFRVKTESYRRLDHRVMQIIHSRLLSLNDKKLISY